jgi:hypothetical protein
MIFNKITKYNFNLTRKTPRFKRIHLKIKIILSSSGHSAFKIHPHLDRLLHLHLWTRQTKHSFVSSRKFAALQPQTCARRKSDSRSLSG